MIPASVNENILNCVAVQILLLLHATSALDFNSAVTEEKFQSVSFSEQGNISFQLHPHAAYGASSQGFVVRGYESDGRNFGTMKFFVKDEFEDPNFNSGISLVILKASFVGSDYKSSRIEMKLNTDNESVNLGTIFVSYPLPDSYIPSHLIFKSWTVGINDDLELLREIEMNFIGLNQMESVYFVVTSYRISKNSSVSSLACEDSIVVGSSADWWNCNSERSVGQLVCINYDLTCDHLPNCAYSGLPNPDENCRFSAGFEEAVELLLYTIVILFIVIIIASIVKCVMVRFCGTRTVEAGQAIREYLRSGSFDRPLNAPPTYDDAMKDVNEAFDCSEEDELPPVYTPEPQQGEEVCNPFTFQADGIEIYPGPSPSVQGETRGSLGYTGAMPPLEPVLQGRWRTYRNSNDRVNHACNCTSENEECPTPTSLPQDPPAYTQT